MSKIIKSVAVVDQRPDAEKHFYVQAHEVDTTLPVLKQYMLDGRIPLTYHPPAKDELLEELNSVRIEIEDSQKELRALNREIQQSREQLAALEKKCEELEQLQNRSIDEEVRTMLQQAEQQAAQIVDQAKTQAVEEVDQLKTQGYLDGLEQGSNEAHERYNAEHEPDVHRLEALINELTGMREDMVRESETDIVNLILTVAEKVIGRAIKEDPKTVIDMLREVMEQNHREEYVKVTISKDLIPATAKASENIIKTIQQLGQQVDVVVSPSDDPGTLIVETEGGMTDLSVPTQLDSIHEMLQQETTPAP